MLSVEDSEVIKQDMPQQQMTAAGGLGMMRRSSWRLLGLGMFFLFYLAIGASVFSAIEAPIETKEKDFLLKKKAEFMSSHPCVTDSALEDLISEIVKANNRGVSIAENGSSVPSWSFGQSFFFASTVVTTIGYGHQSPLSPEGKLFCILYAIIGIPMTLLLLTAVVERMRVPVTWILEILNARFGQKYQPIYIRIAHLIMVLLFVVVFMFLIPAAIFMGLESNWNFLDALYYCFISLTTIGLGDFIPGDTPGQTLRPLYKACTTFYLLVGVTCMMLLLSVFFDVPYSDFSVFFLLRSDEAPNEAAANEDPERIRLNTTPGAGGPKYTQQVDHRTTIVRARSRPDDGDDSPSPMEEGPGPSGRHRLR